MRATVLGIAVASLLFVKLLQAQEATGTAAPGSNASQASTAGDSSVGRAPSVDSIRLGGRTIAAGDTVRGPVVVAAGDLHVRGTILGSAVTVGGDVLVESGGRVTGDAISVFGSVHSAPGLVLGAQRSVGVRLGWSLGEEENAARRRQSTPGALWLSLGWLVVILVMGIGVLVFAQNYLDGVTDVLEQNFWRSFGIGLVGQVAIIPAFVLLVLALAVTVVGILLIPFAIVAYVVAIIGFATLGFLAIAYLTGGSLGGRRADNLHERGRALRALVLGICIYLGMWVVAAAFQWSPLVSGILRGVALAITYAAATAGFGAAILSRGGTRRDAAKRVPVVDADVWLTPTPVTGVVAARRATPAASPRQRA